MKSRAKQPQSRAKVPQSRAKVKQSRAKAPQSRTPVQLLAQGLGEALGTSKLSEKRKVKGWKKCVKFLRKDYTEMCNTARSSVQLLQVNWCSAQMHGLEAEVNWYIGANSIAELPTAVAPMPGVYLAKTTWLALPVGPPTPMASITNLRWLGTTSELLEMTKASRKELGKRKYGRLVQMLTRNC